MKKYLIYNEICKLYSSEKYIIINCYYNGAMWICPNPKNIQLCRKIEKLYNQNKFNDKIKLRLSEEDLMNDKLWVTYKILLKI